MQEHEFEIGVKLAVCLEHKSGWVWMLHADSKDPYGYLASVAQVAYITTVLVARGEDLSFLLT